MNEMQIDCEQGAEEQLKEVWEDSDGLNKKDFDPRTFFYLHGLLFSCHVLSNPSHQRLFPASLTPLHYCYFLSTEL